MVDPKMNTEDEAEDTPDGNDLIESWRRENRAHCLEGERGVEHLEKLCKTFGYRETGFRFGTPVELFLADNPEAIERLVEFMAEQIDQNADWRGAMYEALEVHKNPMQFDDDDEDDDD